MDTARIHRGAILDKARMHQGAILAVQGSLSRGAILGLDNIGWSDVISSMIFDVLVEFFNPIEKDRFSNKVTKTSIFKAVF